MRAFIAVAIPDELKQKISNLQKRLQNFDISLTNNNQMHFTLRFFPDLQENSVEDAMEAIKQTAQKFEKFEINIEGLGTFPNEKYIRVVWLGVTKGKEQLSAVADLLDHELATAGLGHADRKFEPHLTIARIKSIKDKEELTKTIQRFKNIEIGPMKVHGLKLIKSEVRIGGAIHTELANIPF